MTQWMCFSTVFDFISSFDLNFILVFGYFSWSAHFKREAMHMSNRKTLCSFCSWHQTLANVRSLSLTLYFNMAFPHFFSFFFVRSTRPSKTFSSVVTILFLFLFMPFCFWYFFLVLFQICLHWFSNRMKYKKTHRTCSDHVFSG